MSPAEKLNTPERIFLFCREAGFYPVMLPEGTLHDNITGNPGTLAVMDAETMQPVWTQADGYLDKRLAEFASGAAQ